MHEALKGNAPKHQVDWSSERERKVALAKAMMLAHPLPDAPIVITTDTSDYAVGGVHEQWVDGAWQPHAFFSRQLCHMYMYSTSDREHPTLSYTAGGATVYSFCRP